MQETDKKSVQFKEQFTAGKLTKSGLNFFKAVSVLYTKIIKNLEERSVSGHKTLLPFLMTFSFKMNCLLTRHEETKNLTKTKHKVGVLQLSAPKMVALLRPGAWGHNLLPLSNLQGTLVGRSRHHQGAQQLVFLLKEGVRQLLISVCTSGAPRAAPGHLPGTSPAPSDPAAGCLLEQRERACRDSLLLWKTSHVQSKFILGYSTEATIQHDHAERSLRWGERASLPRDGAGPAGHGPRSSPKQPWKSRPEQSRQSPGLGSLPGRGRQCPRKTASLPHVHSRCPSSKQSCRACAQQRSARAIAAQVAAAGQQQNRGGGEADGR